MVIERADNVMSMCEMKYASGEFELKEAEARNIGRRVECLSVATKNRKSIQTVLVTPYGLKRNRHSNCIQRVITSNRLFVPNADC